MILEYLVFDFTPFGREESVSSLERLLQHFDANEVIDQFLFQDKHRPRRSLLIAAPSSSRFSSGERVGLPIGYPRRSGWVCPFA